jgi:Zn-dependent protease
MKASTKLGKTAINYRQQQAFATIELVCSIAFGSAPCAPCLGCDPHMALPESTNEESYNPTAGAEAAPTASGNTYASLLANQESFAANNAIIRRVTQVLEDLYIAQESRLIERELAGRSVARAVVCKGKLIGDAEVAYPQMVERLKPVGYTPMLERIDGFDVLTAYEGLPPQTRGRSRIWLHVVLLLITIITTAISGAQLRNIPLNPIFRSLSRGDFRPLLRALEAGLPFALTLLLILGVHEMAHYLAARRHKVLVSLPYFIPSPFISLLGTFGAVIFIRSPLTNRKALFDVGVSGPLAGFVVALVAFIIGLARPYPTQPNLAFTQIFGGEQLGIPLLLQGLGQMLRPEVSLTRFIARDPILLAAWFGMLLTTLNLLPIGQLDGGHVMYTLFGKASWRIAQFIFLLMITLGLTVFPSLLFFALLAFLTGLKHPPPGNDITPLNAWRKWLGYFTIILFFLIGTATPFIIR